MENIEGDFRAGKYPYNKISAVLGQAYALENPNEILGIEDRIVHFIQNMNDEAFKAKMVEEILTEAVAHDCPALRAALINNCGLNAEAIEDCKAATLGRAASAGNINVVRELLDLHADVNRAYGGYFKRIPMCDAVWSGCGADPIKDSKLPTQLEIVRLLIEAGADLNRVFAKDNNPLFLSLEDPKITDLLIQFGASVDVQDDKGETLLMLACGDRPNLDYVRKLLLLKANVHLVDCHGRTALHHAVYERGSGNVHQKLEIIRGLINGRARINAKTRDGSTPLHIAVDSPKGSSGFLQVLLESGAWINESDNKGETALFKMIENYIRHNYTREFARTGDSSIYGVTHLISNGADIHVANLVGKKPLDLIPDAKTRKEILKLAKEHPWYSLMIFARRFQSLREPLYANLEAREIYSTTTVFNCSDLMYHISSFLFVTK